MKVAVAQLESRLGDLDENFRRHTDYVQQAKAAGADVLLFPEMSLTGHSAGARTLELALRRDDPRLLTLAAAADGVTAIVGLIEEGPAAQFYNSAAVLRGGAVAHIHRKINLATYGRLEDGKYFATGRYVETHSLSESWNAAVLICADLWNPALVHLAALHGATVLFVPVSSANEAVGAGFDNPGGWDLAIRFYAAIYGMPVVMANRIGTETDVNNGDLSFWGGSAIIDPWGKVVAHAGNGEELILADLEYDELRRARFALPTVRDSNFALMLREMNRIADVLGVPDFVRD